MDRCLQTTSSMPSWLNWSTIAAAVCLCNFICPVRSGDFGLVLLFLRNTPSESFCLMGLFSCICISYCSSVVLQVYLSIDVVYQRSFVCRIEINPYRPSWQAIVFRMHFRMKHVFLISALLVIIHGYRRRVTDLAGLDHIQQSGTEPI
jgi:hypothetical protein